MATIRSYRMHFTNNHLEDTFLALSSINLCGSVMDAFQFCTRPTIRCDGEKRNYSFSVRIDEKTRIPTFIVDGIRYTLEQARTNTVGQISMKTADGELERI